jgi:hypothetical protein
MQYRLEKVFEEARNREERYISIIKEQESKRNEEAETYLQTLREIKKEFMDFMSLKKDKKGKQWKLSLDEQRFESKRELGRLNSQEFTLKKAR